MALITVTAPVSGRETLVKEVALENMANIFVTTPVSGKETLAIEVAARNI